MLFEIVLGIVIGIIVAENIYLATDSGDRGGES